MAQDMLIECELIGGPFDGKIHLDDTEKKRNRGLVLPFKNRREDATFDTRWLMAQYIRDSIESTKYYYHVDKK